MAAAQLLPGARGACYSVESNSAALAPPVDPGIYCYAADGTLTAARVGFGTLTLAGPVAPGAAIGHHARTGGEPAAARSRRPAGPHRGAPPPRDPRPAG